MKRSANFNCTCLRLFLGLLFAAFLFSPLSIAAPRGGSVGTATVGGTYYIWAGPWAKMVTDSIQDYTMNIEVTGGPVHNIKLIEQEHLEFGTLSLPAAFDGWNGTDWANGKKYQSIRTLFPMYPSYATFYTMETSGIKTIRDIEGKIFTPGPKGGTPDTYYRVLLDLLSIRPAKIVNTAMNDIPAQIVDGMIDVGAGSGGEPFAPAVELDSTNPVYILDISKEDMEKFTAKYPSWYIGVRPAGGYKLFTEPKPALMYWNFFACHESLDDDLAYQIVDTFFRHLQDFEKVYADTCNTKPSNVLYISSTIPVHPGAARWYAEHGVTIPDDQIGR